MDNLLLLVCLEFWAAANTTLLACRIETIACAFASFSSFMEALTAGAAPEDPPYWSKGCSIALLD